MKTPEEKRAYAREYYKKNKEKIIEYKKNRKWKSEYRHNYYIKNKEKFSRIFREYRETHREQRNRYAAEYYEANKEAVLIKWRVGDTRRRLEKSKKELEKLVVWPVSWMWEFDRIERIKKLEKLIPLQEKKLEQRILELEIWEQKKKE